MCNGAASAVAFNWEESLTLPFGISHDPGQIIAQIIIIENVWYGKGQVIVYPCRIRHPETAADQANFRTTASLWEAPLRGQGLAMSSIEMHVRMNIISAESVSNCLDSNFSSKICMYQKFGFGINFERKINVLLKSGWEPLVNITHHIVSHLIYYLMDGCDTVFFWKHVPQKRAGTHITTNGTRAVTFRKNAFQMRIEFMKYSQVDSYRARYKQIKYLPCCSRNVKFASQVVSLPAGRIRNFKGTGADFVF